MKKLFLTAFKIKKHRCLFALLLLSMALFTIASRLEVVAIGVITKKGPDLFELFGPVQDGKLIVADTITKEQLQTRWNELDAAQHGYVTRKDVSNYLSDQKSINLLSWLQRELDQWFPVADDFRHLALFFVLVALFQATSLFAHRYLTRVIAIRISRDLRQEYFEHIQMLPMSFYQQHNIGSLSSRVVGDASLVAEAVNASLVNYIQTPFSIVSTLLLCFLISWQLSLLVFLGMPAIVIPIIFLAKRVKRISKQIQLNQERFTSVLIEFLAGIQTVKMFAMEDFSLNKYRDRNQKMASLEQRSARYDLASRPIVHTIAMFFLAVALVYGLYVLKMGAADVLVFCGLLYFFYEPVKKFAEENSHIQRGVAAAERIQEVMMLHPQQEEAVGAQPLTQFSGEIEFDNVWFRYGDQWALKGVSFKVRKGEMVAIVGPTGAGKSTIVQLLPRLYEVQKGEIRIDGKPLQSYSQKSLREQIAFVPQKPFIFLDTVSQNIAFGKPFSKVEIQAAARRAHAEEFILHLPQGFETELAEGGKNLSGGQQQRLAIARALIKNASILVMDEATSSLDAMSEHQIKLAMRQLRGDVTQIVIAHRLSTIEDAERIIYIDHGQKIAEGSREELLASCPAFKQMWEMMHQATSREQHS